MKTKTQIHPFLKLIAIALSFALFFMIPTLLIPVSEDFLKRINPQEMKFFLPLLLLFSSYISATYYLLLQNTKLKKTSLFIHLMLAHFMMYPLMGLLESLFWGDAFKGVEISEFIKIFLRFLLTFSLFSGFLSLIAKGGAPAIQIAKKQKRYPHFGIKILAIAIVYFIIYNVFGYFIAWQFEAIRVFYTGSIEKIGFFQSMGQNLSNPAFILVHTFRGLLFGLSGYIFHRILDCSQNKKIMIMSLLFGGFGFQIVLPNPLLPEMVRVSHFIETTSSMLVFGALVGLMLNYNRRINLPAILALLLLVVSCQKEPIIRFGFDSDFGKNSQGITIMNSSSGAKTITLTGKIVLNEGGVLLELNDPIGKNVFTNQLVSPTILNVEESFPAVSGNWKLKYKSLDGEGSIKLHLNIVGK